MQATMQHILMHVPFIHFTIKKNSKAIDRGWRFFFWRVQLPRVAVCLHRKAPSPSSKRSPCTIWARLCLVGVEGSLCLHCVRFGTLRVSLSRAAGISSLFLDVLVAAIAIARHGRLMRSMSIFILFCLLRRTKNSSTRLWSLALFLGLMIYGCHADGFFGEKQTGDRSNNNNGPLPNEVTDGSSKKRGC